MFKKFLFSLIPIGAALTLGLGAIEFNLRQKHTSWDPNGVDSGPRGHRECYRLDINTGYEPIPNKCNRDDKGFYRTWKGDANPEAYRMLVFGDSIADQHMWVQGTTELLEFNWKRPVETKNAGTPGFDTCSELQMFRDKGMDEQFDHVLLQFCPNDLASTATIVALPNERVRFFIGFDYVEFPRWVLSSRILTWISIHTLHRHHQSIGNRASTEPIEHCLREFKELTEQRQARFSVVLFPSFIDDTKSNEIILQIKGTHFNTKRAEEESRKLLDDLNVDYIEVRDIFTERQLSLESHRNVPDDLWHPNDDGQKVIGRALGTWLSTTYPPTKQ